MKTKIFSLVLLSFMALAIVSCNSTEYCPTEDDCEFVIKKIDGKRQWGLVSQVWDGNRRSEYIPCQYDSIYIDKGTPYASDNLFIAVKDGKKYVFSYRGEIFFEGRSIKDIVRHNKNPQHSGSLFGTLFNEAATDGGYYFFYKQPGSKWITFGPYEGFFRGEKGYAFKQNGKWGVKKHEFIDLTPDNIFDDRYEDRYTEIIPAKYDAAIEFYGGKSFWLMKEGKVWKAFSSYDGSPVKISTAMINKFVNQPIMDYKDFQKGLKTWMMQRIGTQEFGHIQYDLNMNFY